jgi:hypothetical protein
VVKEGIIEIFRKMLVYIIAAALVHIRNRDAAASMTS